MQNDHLCPTLPSQLLTLPVLCSSRMFISDDERDARLNRGLKVEHKQHLSRLNAQTTPEFLRPIIGAAAHFSTLKNVAAEFGISTTSAYNMKHGQKWNGEASQVVPEHRAQIDQIIGQAQEKAAEKLMQALGLLNEEKLAVAKAKDLSAIAADMSRVIEKTSPKSQIQATQIVIYAPTRHRTESYEVIEAKD